MDYTMKSPCGTCPFRKEGGVPLHPDRAREIADMMLDGQGGTFPCHKTVDYSAMPDDSGDERIPRPGEIHCAGALIFAEKRGRATQMMRIAERLGLYDHRQFADESKAVVWDSKAQWIKACSKGRKMKATIKPGE